MVLGEVFPDVSNLNMITLEFRIYNMNFIQKYHVKFDETILDTHGHFKATLSNVMDVLGHLTYKLHET